MSAPSFPPPPTEPAPGWPFPTLEPSADEMRDDIGQPPPARRRARYVAGILAVSIAAAAIASGTTAALVAQRAPAVAAALASPASPAATPGGVTAASTTTSPSVATVAAATNPAVVTIQTIVATSGRGRALGATGTGVGSGFIYTADGSILTAAHVVEGASQITVTLADGRIFQGAVAASDANLDVAVVKIKATGLPTIPLGTSGGLQIGQTVIAIGDPLGEFPGSVTVGIVSALNRSVTVADELTRQPRDLTGMVQTDAAINQGNSGGPLIDASGAAIGIVSAGSGSAQGIGFAVPIDAAGPVVARAKTA